MSNDVKTAVDGILARQPDYNIAESYYLGTVSEVFASTRLARLFKNTSSAYRLNFSGTVVDAVNNRLEIASVVGTNQNATKRLGKIWEANEMFLEANEIHRWALTYGDCYAIVWPNELGEVEITYNSPKTTQLFYDPENLRRKAFAAKMWEELGSSKSTRLNLYYPDRIEKYRHIGAVVSGDNNWILIGTVENPFGEIPVFHFRTARPYGRPEHEDAFAPQDMINKLVAIHMTAVDYQGAPQRYALSAGAGNEGEFSDFNDEEADRENIGRLKNGPGELWYLKGVTQVGEFKPADAGTFIDPITAYVRAMASLTDTPLHYFENTQTNVSGEALRVAESPLIKKVNDRQVSFGSTWHDLFKFVLAIEGIKSDVQVQWKAVESMDSLDAWEVAIKKRAVGMPLKQVLMEMGYDEEVSGQLAHEAEAAGATSTTAQPGMNAHNLALHQQKQNAANNTNSNGNSQDSGESA